MSRRIIRGQEKAKEIIGRQKDVMKKTYDEKRKAVMREYQVGQKVLIKDEGRHKKKNPKFQDKFIGPFVITEKVSPVSYRLNIKGRKNMKDCVHVDRIKIWVDRDNEPHEPRGKVTSDIPSDNGLKSNQRPERKQLTQKFERAEKERKVYPTEKREKIDRIKRANIYAKDAVMLKIKRG